MIQIQLEPEIEAQLTAEAQARGLSLDRYIVEKLVGARTIEPCRQHTAAMPSIRFANCGEKANLVVFRSRI
jgi:hypothetical protein